MSSRCIQKDTAFLAGKDLCVKGESVDSTFNIQCNRSSFQSTQSITNCSGKTSAFRVHCLRLMDRLPSKD
jgi:hypothetical protein